MRTFSRSVLLVLTLALAAATADAAPAPSGSIGSQTTLPGTVQPDEPPGAPRISGPPTAAQIQRQQMKALNKKRQEDLKRDTDKLLQLATELKLYVDRSNENTLSLDVIRKAQEIQKLAKSVEKKMRAE